MGRVEIRGYKRKCVRGKFFHACVKIPMYCRRYGKFSQKHAGERRSATKETW